MKIHILTLFPEMIEACFQSSIIGRAAQREILSVHPVDIRDFSTDRHKKVDDYPYGGGAGMLMQAQPVFDAWRNVSGGRHIRTIYLTPQGKPFTQRKAEELAVEEELIFLCGHYEGIDQRVLEETVTDYVSIGDYVLTGGELPAMVMVDAIARLIPGVLGNDASAEDESFYNDLLEYPQYSRPEVWHDRRVPEVLLSGDHKKIAQWRLEQSEHRTAQMRPDLYAKYERKQRLIGLLMKDKRNYIHMIESLRRGRAEILYWDGNDVLLYDRSCITCMISASSAEAGKRMLAFMPAEAGTVVTSQAFLNEMLCGSGNSGENTVRMVHSDPDTYDDSAAHPDSDINDVGMTHRDPDINGVRAVHRDFDLRGVRMTQKDPGIYEVCRTGKDLSICGKYEIHSECYQFLYTQRVSLPVKHKDIRPLAMEHLNYVSEHYSYDDRSYVEARIREGVMYGAFVEDKLVGFIGMHNEGSLGLLYVEKAYRRCGIARSLEAYMINRILEKGWIPYGHVIVGNEESFALQDKIGLYRSNRTVWWLEKCERVS